MAIFNTAYDTTVMQGYPLNEFVTGVLKSINLGRCQKAKENLWVVTDGTLAPPFSHPIHLIDNTTGVARDLGMAIDARALVKPGVGGRVDVRVRDRTNYDLLAVRADLTYKWITGDKKLISRVTPKMMNIYSYWLSGNIARRFALDPGDIAKLQIICAVYWQSLFIASNQWDERFIDECMVQLTQVMRTRVDFLRSVIQDIQPMTDIKSLTDTIKTVTDSVRLKDLTPGVLISIIASTWMGNNKAEILAVAVEHPPTFLSLIYAAINEALYRRVGLAKVALDTLKGDANAVGLQIKGMLS